MSKNTAARAHQWVLCRQQLPMIILLVSRASPEKTRLCSSVVSTHRRQQIFPRAAQKCCMQLRSRGWRRIVASVGKRGGKELCCRRAACGALGAAPGKEQVAGYCSSSWKAQPLCGQLATLDFCVSCCRNEPNSLICPENNTKHGIFFFHSFQVQYQLSANMKG